MSLFLSSLPYILKIGLWVIDIIFKRNDANRIEIKRRFVAWGQSWDRRSTQSADLKFDYEELLKRIDDEENRSIK